MVRVRKEGEFALYKGDELLLIGSIDEIAKKRGVQRNTVLKWGMPHHLEMLEKQSRSYSGALLLIEIEDD